MKPRNGARIGLWLAPLLLWACIGSYEREVEETRAGLVGLSGRDLRRCLGVPTDFDRAGGVERLTYRWVFDSERKSPARIGTGGAGGIVVGPRGAGGGYPRDLPRDPAEQPFCQLDFELENGRVARVTAAGRDDVGLRADSYCVMRARPCVDADDDTEE